MEMDKMQVVWKNQKELRCGYTTGSCAAAAAKAAAAMLFSGEEIRQVSLMTPKGIELYLEVEKIQRENESVSCAIQKDSGDDPDVTNGIFVYAKVTKKREKGVTLDGGIGVGRFTRKVLEQEAGEAAINKVPRQMIREAVQSQIEKYDWMVAQTFWSMFRRAWRSRRKRLIQDLGSKVGFRYSEPQES